MHAVPPHRAARVQQWPAQGTVPSEALPPASTTASRRPTSRTSRRRSTMLRHTVSVFLVLVTLLLAPNARAGHLYVDPVLGNDANPGTTPALPFKHILKGLQAGGTSNDIL